MRTLTLLLTFLLAGVCLAAEHKPASTSRNEEFYAGNTLCEWVALTKDNDGWVRYNAAWALGHVVPEAEPAVPALTDLLTDKSPLIRREAAVALGRVGPEAKAAVPVLAKLLNDTDEGVRYDAAEALRQIRVEAKTAVIALAELLKDEKRTCSASRWQCHQ